MDKVNMSLDQIIKLNRNGPRQNNRGNKKIVGNRRDQRPQPKQHGLLNKSKGINKNRRLNNNRQGKNFATGPNQRRQQIKNRVQKRMTNLRSRLSKPSGNRLPIKPRQNSNGNKFGQVKSVGSIRLQQPRRVNANKSNSAIQAAKKNVEKAKRLLANRISQVKQLSSRLGNRNSKNVKRQQPVNNRAPRVKRLNNQRPVNIKSKPRQQQTNRPQFRRGQQGGINKSKGRMVLY